MLKRAAVFALGAMASTLVLLLPAALLLKSGALPQSAAPAAALGAAFFSVLGWSAAASAKGGSGYLLTGLLTGLAWLVAAAAVYAAGRGDCQNPALLLRLGVAALAAGAAGGGLAMSLRRKRGRRKKKYTKSNHAQ